MSPSTLLFDRHFSFSRPGIPSQLTKWLRIGTWAEAEPMLGWCERAALKCDCSHLHHHSSTQHAVSMNTCIGLAWRVYFYFFSIWWIVKSTVTFRAAETELELFLTISSEYNWNSFHIYNLKESGMWYLSSLLSCYWNNTRIWMNNCRATWK